MRHAESLAFDFDQVFPFVSESLIDPAQRERLLTLARTLPSMDGGFECTLGALGRPADVCVRCFPHEPVARIIKGDHPRVSLPPDVAGHEAWRRAAALLRTAPPGLELWFEYDSADFDAAVPSPNLIVAWADPEAAFGGSNPADALAALGAGEADGVAVDAARRLAASLPPGARVDEVGVMAARPGRPLRLRLGGIRGEDLWSLARDAGWPAAAAQEGLVRTFSTVFPTLAATIDFAGEEVVRFGLPLPCHEWPSAPLHAPRTIAGLSWLLSQDLCTLEEALGLRQWFGWNHDARPSDGFPLELSPDEQARHVAVYRRAFSQFKLVFVRDGAVHAKAYFGFTRSAIDRAGASRLPITGGLGAKAA